MSACLPLRQRAAAAVHRPPLSLPLPRLVPAAACRRCLSQRAGAGAAAGRGAARLYRLLGVDPEATATELKAGFLREARRNHPDLSPEPDAATTFAAIRDSWEVLSSPLRRREYDETTLGGAQPAWVYQTGPQANAAEGGAGGEGWAGIPLSALTGEELESKAAWLHSRIRSGSTNLAALGEGTDGGGGTTAGGTHTRWRLERELEVLTQQHRELRRFKQKLFAEAIRCGGNRGRKNFSKLVPRVDDLAQPAGVPEEVVEEARRAMATNARFQDSRFGEFIRNTYPTRD